MPKKEKISKKGRKDKASKKKEGPHKIAWNPNSAHKGEQIQQWTQEDMEGAMRLYATGKYSQRAISRKTGIHVATLNKRFRAWCKELGIDSAAKKIKQKKK